MKNSIQNESAFFFIFQVRKDRREKKIIIQTVQLKWLKRAKKWKKGCLYVINYPNWSFFAPFLNQRSERDFVQSEAQKLSLASNQ